MQVLTMICSIISVIVSCFAIILGAYAAIVVVGMRNSTHKIEWRPIESPFENKAEDIEDFEEDILKGL